MLLLFCVIGVWGGVAAYVCRKESPALAIANLAASALFFHDAYTLPL